MSEVFIDGIRYVPDPNHVTRLSFYYMYDNYTFQPLHGTIDQIIEAAKNARMRDRYGMLCSVICMNDDREIRRVGECVHGNAEDFSERLDAWKEEILKDDDVKRLLEAEEISAHPPVRKYMTSLIPEDLLSKLGTLQDFLGRQILGQEAPLQEISALLQRSFCGMRLPNRPIASMLFAGSTGVGKTEAVNLIHQHLFGDANKFIRCDCSEFMVADSINILRGSSNQDRGLIGYYHSRSGGDGLILFDEVEKAHPLILDIFLQILSAGRFTASTGETLDLRKYVIVATTNIGSRVLAGSRSTDRETIVRRTLKAVASEMRPEIFGRFELKCVFNKLDWATLNAIAVLHVDKCMEIINGLGHCVNISDGVIEYVQREGYSEAYGARPIQNVAMQTLGDVMAKAMIENHGGPVDGRIAYDRRRNVCELV